jgi:4-hydroxy-3-polyprenylbenzoate decarboxylase
VDDIVNHIVARVLDQFDLPAPFAKRWDGHLHTATKIATVAGSSSPAAKSGT